MRGVSFLRFNDLTRGRGAVIDLSFTGLIDLTAVSEFFDETEVGEVFGVVPFCPGVAGRYGSRELGPRFEADRNWDTNQSGLRPMSCSNFSQRSAAFSYCAVDRPVSGYQSLNGTGLNTLP